MRITVVQSILSEMVTYFGNDVRRINHALKVYGFATMLSNLEGTSEREHQILEYAAILHDIGIKEAERKYHSASGSYQEIEGPPVAKQILEKYKIGSDIIDRVCFLIGKHHTYKAIDGLDFQILVEADFLVNIYEDSMDKPTIESIKKKIFKTSNGIRILEDMYLKS